MIAAAMSPAAWALAVITLLSVDALAIAYLTDRRRPCGHEPAWFDHERFVQERTLSLTQRMLRSSVIAYPCSYGGDIIEFPVGDGWDEDAILRTLDEIGAL